MADLQELIRQKADLERQIAQVQSKGRHEAVDEIHRIMQENGLTVADLAVLPKARTANKATKVRKPVATKYRDGNGNSWTGRGLKPKWLSAALASGKKLEDFAV